MASLKSLKPGEFIALANIVALSLSEGKNAADTIIIGEFISLVGDIIEADGAQKDRLESAGKGKNTVDPGDIPLNA
jgi:hypothetical protein